MRFASIAAAGLCCFAVCAHAETIHWFDSNWGPEGKLVNGPGGALYGTTRFGTPAGDAFKVTPAGVFTELHQFDRATEGYYPGGLMRAADGNFYGQIPYGGTYDAGSIYRMTPAGQVSVLHAFLPTLDSETPVDPLVQAPDGNFYGTTLYGGPHGDGSIFRMTPAGDVIVLYSFNGITDGIAPRGPLAVGADGALYGVVGGGYGRVFRITTAGVYSTVHQFDNGDGSGPLPGLVRAPNGDLYGATSFGGGASGTLFKITAAGQFMTVHQFYDEQDTGWPAGNLIFGTDGNLYGVTGTGGADDCGTAFSMTLAGVVTVFHSFERATEGCRPDDGVTQGPDGALYGTLGGAGPQGQGGIYRILPPSGALPPSWIQPPTPARGELFADIGTTLTIPLRAGDPNSADVVHIAGSGLPAIATLASTDGNPANATFTWTPTSAGVGSRTVTFSATSGADGLSAPLRSFLIHVKFRPALEAKPALVEQSPTSVHLKMKAVLTSQGAPVQGKVVTFSSTKTGAKLCSATTDSAGVAACGSIQTFWRIIANGYTATFAGDSRYWAASASAGLIGQ